MKTAIILLLLQCTITAVLSQDGPISKDLEIDDYEDLGRKHKKRKKHQNNPCYGRSFGGDYTSTYISAPVTNYFFGCGGLPAPVAPYPADYGNGGHGHGHGHGGHGHGGHGHGGHGHGHGGHGHGGHGQGGHGGYGQGGYGGYAPLNNGYNGFQQFNPGFQGFNSPLQNIVSSAASGLGNAVAGYFNRPRKTYRQINKFINKVF